MSKQVVKKIADAIGDEQIASALGVGLHSIRNARWSGGFPASWYPVLKDLSEKAGVPCPMVAFNFKPEASPAAASAKKVGNAVNTFQPDGKENLTNGDAA